MFEWDEKKRLKTLRERHLDFGMPIKYSTAGR